MENELNLAPPDEHTSTSDETSTSSNNIKRQPNIAIHISTDINKKDKNVPNFISPREQAAELKFLERKRKNSCIIQLKSKNEQYKFIRDEIIRFLNGFKPPFYNSDIDTLRLKYNKYIKKLIKQNNITHYTVNTLPDDIKQLMQNKCDTMTTSIQKAIAEKEKKEKKI